MATKNLKIDDQLQSYLTLALKDLNKDCCGVLSFKYQCCNNRHKWTASSTDSSNVLHNITHKLGNKQIVALEFFRKKVDKNCCMETKLLKTICCNNKLKFIIQ